MDREGEAIAWHLLQVLKPKVPVKRMVFHEITREAIQRALESPREVDERLVDAQETRRILDRLYGYEVSPVLWRKVRQGLVVSAARDKTITVLLETQQRHPVFLVEAQFEPAQHRPPAIARRHAGEAEDGRRQISGVGEGEAGRRVLHHVLERRQALQRLQPGLRLSRLGRLGAEAVHEGLHVRALRGDALVQALIAQSWDPSVKSLVPFPDVLGMMNDQLDWTQQVGDADAELVGDRIVLVHIAYAHDRAHVLRSRLEP